MPNDRRAHAAGGRFFFTLVTYQRKAFLCEALARDLLHDAVERCGRLTPFSIDAMVLLPDHLHALWTLPPDDADFSSRWSCIKRTFTQSWLAAGGREGAIRASRKKNRRRGVWRLRFWQHRIRDARDYDTHLDSICYNPVKHGLARCPHAWKWSPFHRLVERQIYAREWRCREMVRRVLQTLPTDPAPLERYERESSRRVTPGGQAAHRPAGTRTTQLRPDCISRRRRANQDRAGDDR